MSLPKTIDLRKLCNFTIEAMKTSAATLRLVKSDLRGVKIVILGKAIHHHKNNSKKVGTGKTRDEINGDIFPNLQ